MLRVRVHLLLHRGDEVALANRPRKARGRLVFKRTSTPKASKKGRCRWRFVPKAPDIDIESLLDLLHEGQQGLRVHPGLHLQAHDEAGAEVATLRELLAPRGMPRRELLPPHVPQVVVEGLRALRALPRRLLVCSGPRALGLFKVTRRWRALRIPNCAVWRPFRQPHGQGTMDLRAGRALWPGPTEPTAGALGSQLHVTLVHHLGRPGGEL